MLIECMAYCAVNCYALVSGYVGVESKWKASNIVYLWLQVLFYTVSITLVFWIVSPEIVTNEMLIRAVLPTSTGVYWYFTAYVGLYMFMPILNNGINTIGKKELQVSIIVIVALFSAGSLVFHLDAFKLDNGYGIIWLMVLYVIGAYIKKYVFIEKKHIKLMPLVYACSVLITYGLVVSNYKNRLFLKGSILSDLCNSILNYLSPTILIASIALILFFSNVEIKRQKMITLITTLSPLTFGVYLIHLEPLIWNNLMHKRFAAFAHLATAKMTICVIASVISIYLICSIVDYLRLKLFNALKVKRRLRKLLREE